MSKISREEATVATAAFLADLQKKGWLVSVNYTPGFRLAPSPRRPATGSRE